MNMFKIEFKAYRKSLILWCIAVFILILSGIGKYSVYAETGQPINELLSQIPESIKAVLGIGNFDLTKASGFYGMLYKYLLLMAAVHASMLGANIISKEERDKTIEFLMVKPVSREKIITAKLFVSLFHIIIFNIVTLFFSIFLLEKYSEGEDLAGEILILMTGMLLLQLMYLLIGTGIAAASKSSRYSASAAAAVLLVSFVLSSVIDMNSNLEGLKYITPFQYFNAEILLYGDGFQPIFLILSFAIIAALICITYLFYKKRDLQV